MIRQQLNLKLLICMTLMVFVMVMSSAVWAGASLSKIRVGQSAEKTRVVFEVVKNHSFEISTLSNPARIVVDFNQAQTDVQFKTLELLDPRVFKIRVKKQKNRTRVVLDLRKKFDYHYFILAKNKRGAERIVVDVLPRLVKTGSKSSHRFASQSTKKRSKKVKTVKAVKHPKKSIRVAKKHPAKSTPIHLASRAKSHSHPTKLLKRPVKKVSNLTVELARVGQVKVPAKRQHLVKKDFIVALDPGHGGKDTGAIGRNNVYEKTITLALALKLKKLIDRQPGMRAILTRNKDVFIPLHKRIQIAHRQDADIFISLHADSYPTTEASGATVYVLSTKGASSKMARLLAKSENASLSQIKRKGDMAFMLSGLNSDANTRASRKLARSILREMAPRVKLHNKRIQSANFAVLKSIDMPSLLIETAFISNPRDEKALQNHHFQSRMSKSILAGLNKFLHRNAKQPRWGETLFVHYKVQPGDTLSEIAYNYSISTYRLKKLNRIKNGDRLYVGRKLKIPVSDHLIASM